MKREPLHFTLYALIIYLTAGALNPVLAATRPSGQSAAHVCGVIDDQWNKRYSDRYPNRLYARSSVANLDVGEPRTVRLIYFLPNDRPYRTDVVQRMKDKILNIQTFFADQMEAHEYGKITFRIETDSQDKPMVHDVTGKHPDSYYLDRTLDTVYPEIEEMFDFNANVYLIVIDNGIDTISYSGGRAAGGRGGRRGKSGGFVLLPSEFTWNSVVHELGHAFGLWHDFNDPRYIMSYGPGRDRLSACHAEYLSVHPYFNSDTPIEEEQVPTIEPISPRSYPAGSKHVSVQMKVSDPEGLHQVLLFVTTIRPHFAAGFLEVKECRGLEGEKDTVVEFDYDGVIPSDGFTSLSDPAGHPITVEAVDTDGNVSRTYFTIAEISPHHITSLDEHAAAVLSVSFSPDGTILASGSWDGTVKLWDVATQQNITTLDKHTGGVSSVSFSRDGTLLASGSHDRTVKLWNVVTRQNIATLDEHTGEVSSVSFSRDGALLASGSWDGTVKLWDIATQQNITTLPHRAEVLSVSFSRDGMLLASGLWDGTVKLWDVATRQNIATLPHGAGVLSVSFSRDGTLLAAGLWDGTVKLRDVATRQNIATLLHGAPIRSVSFSMDGTLASGAHDGTVKLWDVTKRINFATFWHTSPVGSVSFSGTILASATDAGTVELRDSSEWGQARLEALAEVDIPDRNLRAAIEKALGKVPGDTIIASDMENLTRLVAPEAGIMNLTGLEAATNLTVLYLHRNSITDISVVADLVKLTHLSLGSNSITDISAVSRLTNLTKLYLWENSITDISAVSGLTNLTELHLEDNSITDISAVSGLTHLTKLSIWGNNISDISPLVANTGLGRGDEILLQRNPLSYLSIRTYIRTLRHREITVQFDNRAHPALSKVSGDNQEGMPNETLAKMFVVEARSASGAVLVGVSVTFTVVAGGGTLSVTNTTTDGKGRAQSLLTLGPDPGTNTVKVSVEGISQAAIFRAEATPPPPIPTSLEYVSGDNQSGLTGETLMQPFIVEVHDQYDTPMEGVAVTFAVSVGSGSLSDASVDTDVNGLAQSTLTLGDDPGTYTVEVSVEGISPKVVFNAEASLPPPEPTVLSSVSGDNQTSLTGETLMNPFVVEVRDQYDTPMEGVVVTFAILVGGGSLNPEVGTTDVNGQAESTLTLGDDPGTYTVEVSVEGISPKVVFNAEASLPPPEPTILSSVSGDNQTGLTGETLMNPFVVEVRDQYDTPMEGVAVTFAILVGDGSLSLEVGTTDVNGQAESTLTFGSDPGTYTVEVSAEEITEIVPFNAVAELLKFDLALPSGISLIHVPLKVRLVNGVAGTIESVGDLYEALGGTSSVNFLITYDSEAQEWFSYFVSSDKGTTADAPLADDTGVIVGLRAPASIHLSGDPLGTDGNSTIPLNSGLNLVGLPLNDSRVMRVSDLFALDGIGDNVPVIIPTDDGEFKAVVRAGDPSDIPIIGGQSFIMIAQRAAIIPISGDGWYNTSETAAAPLLSLKGVEVGDTTPVLGLRGSIADEEIGINRAGFRVIVKNLSTGRAIAAVTKDENYSRPDKRKSERVGYQVTVVDVETGRAAKIGDILEVSVRSPSPLIGVQPLQYTVIEKDVKQSLIQLPELIAYEIPVETQLLANYPNPFNPETWIPYRLAEDAFVTLTIYDLSGRVVRTLDVGHQIAAVYESRSKAIYWDGRNQVGETVASGVYFYRLSAGDYSATRKMAILK